MIYHKIVMEKRVKTGSVKTQKIMAPDDTDALQKSPAERWQPPARDKPFILVVEDNPTQQKLFRLISPTLGVDIHLAGSAREALLAANEYVFDLILMDIQMPGQDGFECTKGIRALEEPLGRHTPIIAVSAHVLVGYEGICLENGMDGFLAKPFTMDDLSATIRKWIPKNLAGSLKNKKSQTREEVTKKEKEPEDHFSLASAVSGSGLADRILEAVTPLHNSMAPAAQVLENQISTCDSTIAANAEANPLAQTEESGTGQIQPASAESESEAS